MGGGVANFGKMLREQARAANEWRSRGRGERERERLPEAGASEAWHAALLDSPDARCMVCGAAEAEVPLMLVEGGNTCVSCLEDPPARVRGIGAAWLGALGVVLAELGVGASLGLTLVAPGFGYPTFALTATALLCLTVAALWTSVAVVVDIFAAQRRERQMEAARRGGWGSAWLASAVAAGGGAMGVLGLVGLLLLFPELYR